MRGGPNAGVYNSANLGLYGYVYNNPINLLDPDGRYARISRSGNNVRIQIPILFRNDSKLSDQEFQEKIATWQRAIEKTWSGQFGNLKVQTRVSILSESEAREIGVQGGGLNVIEVQSDPKTATAPAAMTAQPGVEGAWSVRPFDKEQGSDKVTAQHKIRGTSEEGQGYALESATGETLAHEAGHLIGLGHPEGNGDGTTMSTQQQGRPTGARPSAAQLQRVVEKYCNTGCRPSGARTQ